MYGIGAVGDPEEYAALERDVIAFAESLDHPADRAVIVLMYLRGMSSMLPDFMRE